jgi:hypothetical protein
MKCPRCSVTIHAEETHTAVNWDHEATGFYISSVRCPACKKYSLFLQEIDNQGRDNSGFFNKRLIEPRGGARDPVPPEVPAAIAVDYVEACNVLPISPKASAALARRSLQAILHQENYKAKNLALEIDLLLNETNSAKAIPGALRETIDGIRNFGNFSAHPISDLTSLQIIDVEPHEAEWCLEILEEMFQHFYVRPAESKKRKDSLNAKLAAGGKPAAK